MAGRILSNKMRKTNHGGKSLELGKLARNVAYFPAAIAHNVADVGQSAVRGISHSALQAKRQHMKQQYEMEYENCKKNKKAKEIKEQCKGLFEKMKAEGDALNAKPQITHQWNYTTAGKSKKLRKSLKPRRKSRKTRRKSNKRLSKRK